MEPLSYCTKAVLLQRELHENDMTNLVCLNVEAAETLGCECVISESAHIRRLEND